MNKKNISIFISIVLLITSLASTVAAAEKPMEQEVQYIDIKIPYEFANGNRPESAMLSAGSPLAINVPFISGYFPAGVNVYTSNIAYIDLRDESIPLTARISKITITSIKSSVPGLDYFIGSTGNTSLIVPNNVILPWESTLTFNSFNDEDPWGIWGFYYCVVRNDISPDLGVGVSLSSCTVRIYYSV